MNRVKNYAASIKQRLLAKARTDNRPFNELLQYYAMERYLYRLSVSEYSQNYVLKGALMLRVWQAPQARPTMDIDLLGKTENSIENIESHVLAVVSVDCHEDRLVFISETMQSTLIAEEKEYHGVRVVVRGELGTARFKLQIDIGFGDTVFPSPLLTAVPTILDLPPPHLYCYPKETAIAEKLEAMAKHGQLNSRIKDFYDIWLLSRLYEFELQSLSRSVYLTFANRGTDLNREFFAFSAEFCDSRQSLWSSFRKRLSQDHIPDDFHNIVSEIHTFLEPAIKQKTDLEYWQLGGPWRKPRL